MFPLYCSAALASAAALMASPVQARGVDAGTLIENTASATYSSGGATLSVDSNTITITVDELLSATLTSQDGGAVSIGVDDAVLTYQITNTGNGPEAFDITVDPAVAGNDFDATVEAIAYDSNGNGVYDQGVDTLITGGTTPSIDADGTLTVFVVVSATGQADGETSQVAVDIATATGTGTPGTSFASQGAGGGNAVVGFGGGVATATGDLLAQIVSLTLTKSATIADPFGGTDPVPGAIVTFTITASLTGGGSIDDLRITDPIPANTTYSAGSLTLESAALTDAADSDAGSASASGIDVLIGTASGGSEYSITFDVIID